MSIDLWRYEQEQDRLFEEEEIRQEVRYRLKYFIKDLKGQKIPFKVYLSVKKEIERVVRSQIKKRKVA